MKCNAVGKVRLVPIEVGFWISVFLVVDAVAFPLTPLFLYTTSITLLPGTLIPDFLLEPALSRPLVHNVWMEQIAGERRRLL